MEAASSPILQQITDKQPQIDELCQRHQVARLEIFGSATSNRFQDPTSDIDFLVEFTVNTPQGAADRFFGLKQGLSDLFERAIDLVEIQTIQNPYFLEAIERDRTSLYLARTPPRTQSSRLMGSTPLKWTLGNSTLLPD